MFAPFLKALAPRKSSLNQDVSTDPKNAGPMFEKTETDKRDDCSIVCVLIEQWKNTPL